MRLSLVPLSIILGVAVSTTSASCLDQISANTMGVFSGVPLTFASGYLNGSACAYHCDALELCNAWLYSVAGGECQLYKQKALSTFKSQKFMYGICGGHTPKIASSSAAPVHSASSSMVSNAPIATPSALGAHGAVLN
ncbi:hypothetical protein BO70DRAFT_350224 [Aspergillus heteromorphus CBS 117.55]|uniref:Apple domain-containing protein n=1 Tax=Aspergillus heteromorphus CBS 117.55 TaxID=1448321 RepID=A0A317WSD8_9EURO|nr:uncharacterized protein BO70DRAFT_350224 [Aspergillus heteromorphus CBS 117.55]PWY88965.1 hypothetical protein BO70DRAFT_350224 [Aspergillus heteromorphus CBS 117.55]